MDNEDFSLDGFDADFLSADILPVECKSGIDIFQFSAKKESVPKIDAPKIYPKIGQTKCDRNQLAATFKANSNFRVPIESKARKSFEESEQSLSKRQKQILRHDERLWVEKYRPKRTTDFVGNEKGFLDVLKWLDSWKKYKTSQSKKSHKSPETNILLISGPPGIGKTSLVNVLAKTTGFAPIEVNASDERNGEELVSKIKLATGSTRIFSGISNLLVLDEIDGAADNSLLKFLVECALNAKNRGSANGDEPSLEEDTLKTEPSESTPKKKKASTKTLESPIVCICNDLYAPVLRNLKAVAFSVQMKKLNPSEVVPVLERICEKENFVFESKALYKLAELLDGDVRSCINNLQMSRYAIKRFTFEAFQTCTTINKDIVTSVYHCLENVFYSRPFDTHHKGGSKRGTHFRLVDMCENIDKLVSGCFENYLLSNFNDISFDKSVEIGDWMHFYDLLATRIGSNSDFELSPYLALVPLLYKNKCCSSSKKLLVKYPKTDYEFHVKHSYNAATLEAFKRKTVQLSSAVARLDILSPFACLIDPSARIFNPSLLKSTERQFVERVAKLMKAYDINFMQLKSSDGEYQYKLDPPIQFLLLRNTSTNQLSLLDFKKNYNTKQLISQQITKLLINDAPLAAKEPKKDGIFPPQKRKVAVAFGVEKQPIAESRQTIWYKYNEGISNAVRKTLKIKDLFCA